MPPRLASLVIGLLILLGLASGHGEHQTAQDGMKSQDWAVQHMKEEHHIDNFDAGSFFSLHDFDGSGTWTPNEIRKTYGLEDPSNAHLSEQQKQQVVRDVLKLFDPLNLGYVSHSDWMRRVTAGIKLPDFGFGPGHHGDLEYEYEIHHFEKYHGDDAKEEDLTHPEDIEHFRKHDEEEIAGLRLEQLERMAIVEGNIPQKFLRNS